jgi:hypothetical protein
MRWTRLAPTRWAQLVASLSGAILVPLAWAAAQQPSAVDTTVIWVDGYRCVKWRTSVAPDGAIDRAYAACALKPGPEPDSSNAMPDLSPEAAGGEAAISLFVNADGTVDTAATRVREGYKRLSPSSPDLGVVLNTIDHWHFSPGRLHNRPVRSAIDLTVEVDGAPEGADVMLHWQELPHFDVDFLMGTWMLAGPARP